MTRPEILDTAKKCVCGQREQDYGTPEDNFSAIADLWEAYLYHACLSNKSASINIRAKDVAAMMVLFKVARTGTGQGSEDSWVDMAGYAACGGEIATRKKNEALAGVNTCVSCGAIIPEGRQVCPTCEKATQKDKDA